MSNDCNIAAVNAGSADELQLAKFSKEYSTYVLDFVETRADKTAIRSNTYH